MNNFVKAFTAIEDSFNEKVRGFVERVRRSGLSWPDYEMHENAMGQYLYQAMNEARE